MLGSRQENRQSKSQSSPFSQVNFFLSGFNPTLLLQVKSKLLRVGAVCSEDYGPNCTHVIVHRLLFDDPICVTARKDGKTLVTSLWVDRSLEAREPLDPFSIVYRPPKELNGIPGAKDLVICLTGYQRQEREDIMTMASLMGAEFSKPLVAHKVTHLICYKFEGEKYDLAMRVKTIKLINHRWLEDCLKEWKILPEEHYNKSGYELEMMEAEADDSEESGDIRRKLNEGSFNYITSCQNEMVGAQRESSVPSKMSTPSAQQGLSNNVNTKNVEFPIKEEMKSNQASETGILTDQQSPRPTRQHHETDVKSHDVPNQSNRFPPSEENRNENPSTPGNAKISNEYEAAKLSDSSYSRKSSTRSLAREEFGNLSGANAKSSAPSNTETCSHVATKSSPAKLGDSDEILKENLAENAIDDVSALNPESNKEIGASACVGVASSKQLADRGARKPSPLSSGRISKRSSLSPKTSGKRGKSDGVDKANSAGKVDGVLTSKTGNSDGVEKDNSAEKVDSVLSSNPKLDNGQAASACSGTFSARVGLTFEDGPLLQEKMKVDDHPNVSHGTPKRRKLSTSGSKRIDATELPSPATSPLVQNEDASLRIGSHTGDEIAKPSSSFDTSPNVPSNKLNAKSTLTSDMLEGTKSMSMPAMASPNTTSTALPTSVSTCHEKEPERGKQETFFASGSKDSQFGKSTSPKLNTDDPAGNSISKPSRKKSVARKTLGSRPKLSKRSAARNESVSGSTFEDVPIPSMLKMGEGLANAPSADLGSELLPSSRNETNGSAGCLDDETEAPLELDIENGKFAAEASTKVGTGALLWQPDEPELTTSTAAQTCSALAPATETGNKKRMVAQKKGFSGLTRKKTVLPAKKTSEQANEAEGQKNINEAGVQNGVAENRAVRKLCDTVLLDRIVEFNEKGKETYPVSDNDPGVIKDGKHVRSLAREKMHGTQLPKKSEDSFEIERENEPLADIGEGKANIKQSRKLATKSNPNKRSVEAEGDGTAAGNDPGTTKAGKLAGKLAGKKRRGTLLLNKAGAPVEVETDSGSVQVDEGENNEERSIRKVKLNPGPLEVGKENDPVVHDDENTHKGRKRAGKFGGKKRRALTLSKSEVTVGSGKENEMVVKDAEGESNGERGSGTLAGKHSSTGRKTEEKDVDAQISNAVRREAARFLISGPRPQRKEFQQLIKRFKGKVCRDSHQWSYQATHLILPEPIRRTEKFFAAAASGRWILKADYLTASSEAGNLLPEEPYEWHNTGLTEDGAINLEAPRKWRLVREKTGHGALYGMRIIVYGECIAPSLDTLKRVVKAGDGTILATSPPYSRFLKSGVDFAIVSPGMPRVDVWVQEFLKHEIPCVSADFLVEYVCKPGYSLDKHVLFNTHEWAAKSHSKLLSLSEESVAAVCTPDDQFSCDVACEVCGSTDRGEVMLICGDENGSSGCGIGTHIDCCDPPLEDVPEEDWFCPKCIEARNKPPGPESTKKKASSKRSRGINRASLINDVIVKVSPL